MVEVVVDFLAISAQPIFHQNKIAMLGKVIICLLVIFAIYASANPNPSGESPSPTMMDPPAPMPRAYENAQENVRQEKCLHALSLQVARLQEELNAHQESIIYSSQFESFSLLCLVGFLIGICVPLFDIYYYLPVICFAAEDYYNDTFESISPEISFRKPIIPSPTKPSIKRAKPLMGEALRRDLMGLDGQGKLAPESLGQR